MDARRFQRRESCSTRRTSCSSQPWRPSGNLDSFPRDTITGTIHATKSLSIEIKAASYTFNNYFSMVTNIICNNTIVYDSILSNLGPLNAGIDPVEKSVD